MKRGVIANALGWMKVLANWQIELILNPKKNLLDFSLLFTDDLHEKKSVCVIFYER
jgi:hypothetical protein